MTPFMALKQMSEEQGYDPDVVKRLVYLLSDALPKEQVKSGSGG
jgi:HD-GYP domain-containing protein (c-di-GMP phosphodiesterase class II)